MARDLTVLRHSVEQIAVKQERLAAAQEQLEQFAAKQEQMAQDIAKLQAVGQNIRQKLSPRPLSRTVPVSPSRNAPKEPKDTPRKPLRSARSPNADRHCPCLWFDNQTIDLSQSGRHTLAHKTLAKSLHRAPHGSFILSAIFFGHSAVSSSSQSMSFASRPRKRDTDCEFISLWMRFDEQHQQMWVSAKEPGPNDCGLAHVHNSIPSLVLVR
jgi:hypothetical protein